MMKTKTFQTAFSTPIGTLKLVSDGSAVTEISVCDETVPSCRDSVLLQLTQELAEYFAGKREEFTVPLAPQGTPFQKTVWMALRSIPFGQTVTYGTLAAMIGRPKACRAVGGAVGKNPILILQPCHRVVAQNGIGGFSAGLDRKQRLLALEKGESL